MMSDQRFGLGALGREGVSDVDEGLLLVLLLESWIVKEKRSEKREKLRLFPSRIHFFVEYLQNWSGIYICRQKICQVTTVLLITTKSTQPFIASERFGGGKIQIGFFGKES